MPTSLHDGSIGAALRPLVDFQKSAAGIATSKSAKKTSTDALEPTPVDGGTFCLSDQAKWLPKVGLLEPFSEHGTREIPCYYTDSGSAPGATRTPNLLIRRSPSGVLRRPQECIRPLAEWFRFHLCPRPSSVIHHEWLPTWLPAGALAAIGQPGHWPRRRPTHGAETPGWGMCTAGCRAGCGFGDGGWLALPPKRNGCLTPWGTNLGEGGDADSDASLCGR